MASCVSGGFSASGCWLLASPPWGVRRMDLQGIRDVVCMTFASLLCSFGVSPPGGVLDGELRQRRLFLDLFVTSPPWGVRRLGLHEVLLFFTQRFHRFCTPLERLHPVVFLLISRITESSACLLLLLQSPHWGVRLHDLRDGPHVAAVFPRDFVMAICMSMVAKTITRHVWVHFV